MSEFINPFAERDIFSEMRKAKEEEKRKAEEARRLAEEAEKKRQEEECLKAEEARRLAEEAEKKRQEEERLQREEAERQAEEARRLAEEVETRRRIELAKLIGERMVLVECDSGDSFYIGKYPVTQKDWMSVMGSNPSHFQGENRPVENVTWYDAIEFCNKLSEKDGLNPVYRITESMGKKVILNVNANGYRLPTDKQWGFAARGGNKSKGFKYAGSDNIDEVAWYLNNSGDETHDVGLKEPNELGLYDMSGNVWEWCWDTYMSYSCYYRGGSYCDYGYRCKVDSGGSDNAYSRSNYLGFRIICSI